MSHGERGSILLQNDPKRRGEAKDVSKFYNSEISPDIVYII